MLILTFPLLLVLLFMQISAKAATNLKLNPKLEYSSDSNKGPLITVDNITDGMVRPGKPAYIIFYQNEFYNSKRQAKRTVELYEKYKGKVDFIIIDLHTKLSKEQKELKARFYQNHIPHVTVIDSNRNVLYNRSGEIDTNILWTILDDSLM